MQHHLAIVYRAYLDEIVAGKKTVECRLGKMGYPPHNLLEQGDLIWFKEPSGPIHAVASVRSVCRFSDLKPETLALIRRDFNRQIRAPAEFWDAHGWATEATLIWLQHVCPLRPFRVEKSNRRAWMVLAAPPVPGEPIVPARPTLRAPSAQCVQ